MTKEKFRLLFEQGLEVAAHNAELNLGRTVPRRFEIEMHGLAARPGTLTMDDAFKEIYLGPDRFYRVIDLAIIRVSSEVSTAYMNVSGHEPGTFDQTWNDPVGSGPFKQVLANKIKLIL